MRGGRDGIIIRSAGRCGIAMLVRGTVRAVVRGLDDGRPAARMDGNGGIGGRGSCDRA